LIAIASWLDAGSASSSSSTTTNNLGRRASWLAPALVKFTGAGNVVAAFGYAHIVAVVVAPISPAHPFVIAAQVIVTNTIRFPNGRRTGLCMRTYGSIHQACIIHKHVLRLLKYMTLMTNKSVYF
jgi:hypothetical protein